MGGSLAEAKKIYLIFMLSGNIKTYALKFKGLLDK